MFGFLCLVSMTYVLIEYLKKTDFDKIQISYKVARKQQRIYFEPFAHFGMCVVEAGEAE